MSRQLTGEAFLASQNIMEIMTQHGLAKDWVQDWHTNIKRWRALYDFIHYSTRRKPGESRYADPTPTNVVDLAVGVFMQNYVDFKAVGWTPSQQEEVWSSRVEKYLLGTLDKAVERTEHDVVFDITKNFIRDGAAVIYSVWDTLLASANKITVTIPDLDPASPTGTQTLKGYKESPIRVDSIDPLKLTMLPGGNKRWLHVFRTELRTVYDIEKEYGITIDRYVGRSAFEKMQLTDEFIDYWRYATVGIPLQNDEGTIVKNAEGLDELEDSNVVINAVIFGGQFIIPPRIMQGYEEIPYSVGFYKPVEKNVPKKWHSILRPIETSIKYLEMAINRRMHQITAYSEIPLVFTAAPGRAAPVIEPGINFKQINNDEGLAFVEWPGNPPDVEEHIGYLRGRLQQAGFSDVMYGMSGQSGTGATFAIQQLADQNRIRLLQPARQLEILWTIWARKTLSMTEKFAKNSIIRVFGSKKDKDFAEQIKGEWVSDFLVKALIQPEMPGESTRKHAMATQIAGRISNWTLMQRYLDIKQPDEERERQLIEKALDHPAMQLYGIIRELVDMANDSDVAAIMTLQQIQGGGLNNIGSNNPNGRPTGPNNPEQGIGLSGSTGVLPPQAQGGAAPGQSVLENQQGMAKTGGVNG